MTAQYPRWMRFIYMDHGTTTRYYGCMNNAKMMLQAIHRLRIKEHLVKEIRIDEKLLTQEEVIQLFQLYYKHQQSLEEEDEKLAKAIEAKGRRNLPKKK